MKKVLLNITTVQDGYKIQLVREVRKFLGEEVTKPGQRIAFYLPDGQIIIEPIESP